MGALWAQDSGRRRDVPRERHCRKYSCDAFGGDVPPRPDAGRAAPPCASYARSAAPYGDSGSRRRYDLSVARMLFASVLTAHASATRREAPLPWSDVNLLIVTDVHSWVAGHTHADHTPVLDADYGAVLSLYERLAATAAKAGRDLFFVQNGDLNDGTGLSAVSMSGGLHDRFHTVTLGGGSWWCEQVSRLRRSASDERTDGPLVIRVRRAPRDRRL